MTYNVSMGTLNPTIPCHKAMAAAAALYCDVCIYSMVEKDPAKRPTASDALRFPFVLHQIEVCLHAWYFMSKRKE